MSICCVHIFFLPVSSNKHTRVKWVKENCEAAKQIIFIINGIIFFINQVTVVKCQKIEERK